jgi:hypothetical protein
MSPEERTPAALEAARRYVATLRRKLFFEGFVTDPESGLPKRFLDELVPFENIDEFIRFIETQDDQHGYLKHAIILAISRSESIYDEQRGRENICIRTRHDASSEVNPVPYGSYS